MRHPLPKIAWICGILGATLWLGASPAEAQLFRRRYPPRVYYAPAPVVVRQQPVYATPAPISTTTTTTRYIQPAPVVQTRVSQPIVGVPPTTVQPQPRPTIQPSPEAEHRVYLRPPYAEEGTPRPSPTPRERVAQPPIVESPEPPPPPVEDPNN